MLRGAEFIRPSSAMCYSGPLEWLDCVTYTNPARRDLFSREGQRGTKSMSTGLGLTVGAMLLPEPRQY